MAAFSDFGNVNSKRVSTTDRLTKRVMTQFSCAQKIIFHGRFYDNDFLIVHGSIIFEISNISSNFRDTTEYNENIFTM